MILTTWLLVSLLHVQHVMSGWDIAIGSNTRYADLFIRAHSVALSWQSGH